MEESTEERADETEKEGAPNGAPPSDEKASDEKASSGDESAPTAEESATEPSAPPDDPKCPRCGQPTPKSPYRQAPQRKPLIARVVERVPWIGLALTAFGYAVGLVWRYLYIFTYHDPRKFVYSDMRMYVELAKRLSPPTAVVTIGDITHPPGETWVLEWFYQHYPAPGLPDGLSNQVVWFHFIVCALLPLATGALGWVAFGRKAGMISTVVASLYYPFVEFGGFFLAEIHIALWATTTIALYLLAMRLAAQSPSAKRTIGIVVCAILGGFAFSLAMAFKMVAIVAIGGFIAIHVLFAKTNAPKFFMRVIVAAAFCVCALPVTYKLVARCTAANHVEPNQPGEFCTGSNKSASDFLLGHYDRIQSIQWKDPKYAGMVGFGSPASYQHGYRNTKTVPFLITNQKANNAEAFKWIRENPFEAFVLQIEHVWDLFATYPWPPNATGFWPMDYMFHFLFVGFLLFPTMFLMVDVLRKRGVMGFIRSDELMILSPILGVCLAVALATGEARYRIPWDASFIVLAVEFYRRFLPRLRWSEPAATEVPAEA